MMIYDEINAVSLFIFFSIQDLYLLVTDHLVTSQPTCFCLETFQHIEGLGNGV